MAARSKVSSNDDPLTSGASVKVKTECLTIKPADEARIVSAMIDASKRKTQGNIFSVKVDISNASSLGIGVKDLQDCLLAISMLKRINGQLGPVESAGMRLGDIIFGVNFLPCRDGSKTLLSILKGEMEKGCHNLHLQCWRCKQLCAEDVPGVSFVPVNDMVGQAFAMYRSKVFSEWERWNFIEILLCHMVEELHRDSTPNATVHHNNQIHDLQHNILQAKGLRTALCVRIVHTKIVAEAVIYVLRVEDVETGLQWVVHRRYRDFHALNDELLDLSHFTQDVSFPKKKLNALRKNARVVEERIVALEQYIRRVLHVLTLYATMDPYASRSLRHAQNFLGVDRYVDCVHPPLVDDQRCIELMAYQFLNDFSSAACQQCVRFVAAVDLDSLIEEGPFGYKPVLKHLALALSEVEAFVLEQHEAQMQSRLLQRRPHYNTEQCRVFVRRCVRRQVEAAIFLPLRRILFRIVYSFVAVQAQSVQRAMGLLQQAAPDYFEVDPIVLQSTAMPKAIKAFRDVISAYLPADQGQLLMHAAAAVIELYGECSAVKGKVKIDNNNNNANNAAGPQSRKSQHSHEPSVRHSLPEKPPSKQTINSPDGTDEPLSLVRRSSASNTDNDCKPAFNLTSAAAMADPVGTIFHAHETSSPSQLLTRTPSQRRFSGVELDLIDQIASKTGDKKKASPVRRYSTNSGKSQETAKETFSPSAGAFLPVGNDSNADNMETRKTKNMKDATKTHDTELINERLAALGMLSDADTIVEEESTDESIGKSPTYTTPLFPVTPAGKRLPQENLSFSPDSSSSIARTAESSAAPESLDDRKSSYFSSADKGLLDFLLGGHETVADGRRASDFGSGEVFDGKHTNTSDDENNIGATTATEFYESKKEESAPALSADDFLPMFTFVLVQASLPQLLLVKEIMTTLVDDEEAFGECGYYLATLEAATQHIVDLAEQFDEIDKADQLFNENGDDVF